MTTVGRTSSEIRAKLKVRGVLLPGPGVPNSSLSAAHAAYSAAETAAGRAKADATRADEIAVKVKALRAQKGARSNDHPKVGVVRALKQFIDLRDFKIAKQTRVSKERKLTAGDHLIIAKAARQLAERLSDAEQIRAYMCELRQVADAHTQSYREKFGEVIEFWYGPAGLSWLAWQKQMDRSIWSEYVEFMDAAAQKACDGGARVAPSFLEQAALKFELEPRGRIGDMDCTNPRDMHPVIEQLLIKAGL